MLYVNVTVTPIVLSWEKCARGILCTVISIALYYKYLRGYHQCQSSMAFFNETEVHVLT